MRLHEEGRAVLYFKVDEVEGSAPLAICLVTGLVVLYVAYCLRATGAMQCCIKKVYQCCTAFWLGAMLSTCQGAHHTTVSLAMKALA